ncbi:Hypothetical_protein [Hexamita inflata]|uniref:Hypothetical_protein n=1 Tax=Hexamita inflata TaxID=28002 RepID=A0AA86UM84_9EUKA|nr:Hypothetical protein HINF_LOCUS51405 [Hexamita inflata]
MPYTMYIPLQTLQVQVILIFNKWLDYPIGFSQEQTLKLLEYIYIFVLRDATIYPLVSLFQYVYPDNELLCIWKMVISVFIVCTIPEQQLLVILYCIVDQFITIILYTSNAIADAICPLAINTNVESVTEQSHFKHSNAH